MRSGVRLCICGCPYLLCGEVQSGALAVVCLVDRGSSLQQNLCTIQAVSQDTVHQRGPAKLVLTVPQRGICYIHTRTDTHTTSQRVNKQRRFGSIRVEFSVQHINRKHNYVACDGICYKLFLKGSLLLLQFNRNSTSTSLNKSEQLETISKYCNTDNLEDHIASLRRVREFAMIIRCSSHIFISYSCLSKTPFSAYSKLNINMAQCPDNVPQEGGPSFSRGAAVPASMLTSTCSAVVSLCKTQKLVAAAAADPAQCKEML